MRVKLTRRDRNPGFPKVALKDTEKLLKIYIQKISDWVLLQTLPTRAQIGFLEVLVIAILNFTKAYMINSGTPPNGHLII